MGLLYLGSHQQTRNFGSAFLFQHSMLAIQATSLKPGYFMNCCRETTKVGLPPGNRPAVPRDWFPYLNGTSQGPTPEDARKDGQIRGRSK
jgi:hypothetical protein